MLQIVTDAAAVTEPAILVSEPLYAALESAGLPSTLIAHASGMFIDYVNGFVLGESGIGTATAPDRHEITHRLSTEDPTRLPARRRVHAATATAPAGEYPSGFDTSIEIMIDGLRALR